MSKCLICEINEQLESNIYYMCQECLDKERGVLPKYSYSLLKLVEYVHMVDTGTHCLTTIEYYNRAVITIRDRVCNWENSVRKYDEVVKTLCHAVLCS